MAVTVFAAGRRRLEAVVLAAFLGLVAANFGLGPLAHALGSTDAQFKPWYQAATIALALDPPFLVAFVTLYPYRRQPPAVRALLGALAVSAVMLVLLILFRPDRLVADPNAGLADLYSPEHLLLIGQLAVAYAASWLLAVRSALDAPSRLLARQAGWVVAAVGIATVPRMGLLQNDFGVGSLFHVQGGTYLLQAFLGISPSVALFLAGAWLARRAQGPELRPMMRFAAAAVAAVLAARFLLDSVVGLPYAFPLRWPLFAALLMWGMLSFEVLELRRARERTVPLLGGFLGAVGFGLLTAVALSRSGTPGVVVIAVSLAAALGAAVPAGVAARALAGLAERGPGLPGRAERRLELYRATLENAWAQGPPDAEGRRRLERERRAFGVSVEEGRALEHVVATQLAHRAPRLRPGDEPSRGLVLEGVLGEGSHGRVFLARRYPKGDRVVVKEFHADAGDQASRARLLQEFRILQALEHPNIVRPLDIQASAGRYLLVMEHVDGESLAARLARGPLSGEEARRMLLDVLDALETAHARRVVHRDVKPSNILLGRDGRAHLSDFSLAGPHEALSGSGGTIGGLQGMGAVAGTLGYMAPEQARGLAATPSSDLYALGLVAFEALSGRPARDLRHLGFFDALREAAETRPDLSLVPASWRPVLARALDPLPAARYASAAGFRAAVRTMGRQAASPAPSG